MSVPDLLTKLSDLADWVASEADSVSGGLSWVKGLILETFGPSGLLAACFVVGVLLLIIGWHLSRIAMSALKYLVVPAIGLALLGSLFMPSYSFMNLLPATTIGCSMVLFAKS